MTKQIPPTVPLYDTIVGRIILSFLLMVSTGLTLLFGMTLIFGNKAELYAIGTASLGIFYNFLMLSKTGNGVVVVMVVVYLVWRAVPVRVHASGHTYKCVNGGKQAGALYYNMTWDGRVIVAAANLRVNNERSVVTKKAEFVPGWKWSGFRDITINYYCIPVPATSPTSRRKVTILDVPSARVSKLWLREHDHRILERQVRQLEKAITTVQAIRYGIPPPARRMQSSPQPPPVQVSNA